MRGLMQDTPLTLQLVFERATSLYADKRVATKTTTGIDHASYGEVADRVTRLAAALADLGVGPGDRVATFAWNSQRHVELYLAVPCMGAVLHTLNPRLHPEQVAFIAAHAEDRVVFVDASLAGAWAKVADIDSIRDVVWMDDLADGTDLAAGGGDGRVATHDYEALLDDAPTTHRWPHLDEADAAAMCYTSGTTGEPRGVVYSHRSATLHTMGTLFADFLGLRERDVLLPIVPQFHANAWGTPYGALLAGADLAMPGRYMADPAALAALCRAEGVTVSAAVPTVWFGVLQAIRAGEVDPEDFASLERIICGGSAMPEPLMRAYDELGIEMVHAWGMTETSPLGSLATVRSTVSAQQRDAARLSQGVPAPTLSVRIVDADERPQPWDGESMGELQISGPWIADAYYDPAAPDDRGGHDRFADTNGRRWLRTGDVAVIDADGYLRLLDRTKDLVKSGGEWISSVELENLLMTHDAVAEAAVIAVPDEKWDERPLACVVAAGEITEEALLDYLAERLARWQVPDAIAFIDEVPKTSVGKFDKKVLRERFA